MSNTIFQQGSADIFVDSLTNANSCCINMGGLIETGAAGIEMCTIYDSTGTLAPISVPLSTACLNLTEVSTQAPSVEQTSSGGGFGGWLTNNFSNITNLVTGILGNNNAQTPSNYITPPVNTLDLEAEKRKKQMQLIVFITLGVVTSFLIYKSLKK